MGHPFYACCGGAVTECPAPRSHPVVAGVGEVHRVADTHRPTICLEPRFAEDGLARSAGGCQVRGRPELVPLGRIAVHGSAHARPLARGEHAAAVGILHVILHVVQRSARFPREVAGQPADRIRGIIDQIIFVAVVRKPRLVRVAPRVTQIHPVPCFVRQRPRPVGIARADGATVIVGDHDAVLTGALAAIHRCRIEAVARGSGGVLHDPNVQVLVPRPLDQVLHPVVPDVGQLTDNPIDTRMAVPVRVPLGEAEFNLDVCRDAREFGNDRADVRVQLAEIAVHHLDRAVHLLIADVLRAIEVDDMEHHRDDDQLVAVAGLCESPRFAFERRIRLQVGLPQEGVAAEEPVEGFGLSAGSGCGLARRGCGKGPNKAQREKRAHRISAS